MATATNKKNTLTYKGYPLLRKDNVLYYGSMADSHIIMMQILSTEKQGDLAMATRVAVQLQQTSPGARTKERVVRKTEKDTLWAAIDIANIWLTRARSGK